MLNNNPKLVIATSNQGKLGELRHMLANSAVSVISLADLPEVAEVVETGATFAENAVLKATCYAREFGLPTIADDSGLEIAAIGGRPGVHSARYGGDSTFAQKMALVLAELLESGSPDRRARFVSAIAFSDGSGRIIQTVEGDCSGVLAYSPRGSGGFGYDPIFVPEGFCLTFGELPDTIKSQISHRASAFSKIMPYLRDFYAV